MDTYADYDPFADAYNRHWGGFATRMLPVLDRLILSDLEEGSLVLDLCCGTGQLASALTDRGHQVIGVDGSEAMIDFAIGNAPEAEFLVADARSFILPDQADAAVSTFDSLNHIMSRPDLVDVFRHVYAALKDGAPFLLDLNMEEGYQARWRGSFGIVTDDEVIVARSAFDADEVTGRMDFTLLTPDGDHWRREDLALSQHCYSEDDVRGALAEAAFHSVEVLDGTELDVGDFGRSFFLGRKRG